MSAMRWLTALVLALSACGVRGAPQPPKPESQPHPTAIDAGTPEEAK